MNKAGRKPKPTALKQLHGTFRQDRVLENEAQLEPLNEIPLAPENLPQETKDLWFSIHVQAQKLQMLSKIGSVQLARYCDYHAIYCEARDNIFPKKGKMKLITTSVGSTGQISKRKNEYFTIMREASDEMRKIESEWGFTPSSATRIPMPKQEDAKQNDEFDL